MARPKSFNETQVLTQMMEVFWRQGYAATFMRHLEKASGLTAGSIYHEFGSKKALFERTLSFYINTVIGWRVEKYLTEPANPIEGIREFLVTTFKGVPQPYRQQACLLVNTAAELGQSDPDIGRIVNRGMRRIETAMAQLLAQAAEQQLINPDLDTELAARHISLLMPGLLIAARNQAKDSDLESVVNFHLSRMLT
ncbi:TetR/AcrR family transcriptional regulator [Alcanivorax jadensis]|uniref:TetR/AcrR family transcriptional regulator n=1 Tax=Alcanivorax jadensis TaxID=64988 RepID=UPI0023547631|nr:TetR/AcrR family transcriptional regulator [Alcanivorax jadensis]|tara:strand:+ start:50486 stop:51073 length:588 start_codon:yes stop_codon:yes gene_type:complete